jgi:lipopolysaccharide biosynthesis glycosyltransferase
MNIVFCADRSVLPGLHVAAYSLLGRMSSEIGVTRFHLFSDKLTDADVSLLRQTLMPLSKRFTLELHRVDASLFTGFPPLNGSWATYYRLAVPQILDVKRFLYVDADTLCDVDVGVLQTLEMNDAPAGWVPEAPLPVAVDQTVAKQMGNAPDVHYFNAGVMLINVETWRKQKVTEKAMNYIAVHRPVFHDQSALNVVLQGNAFSLDNKFNCMSNMRKNWPVLRRHLGKMDCLVHFLDYPKPWDWLAEFVHPQYRLWRSVSDRTAMKGFRSWHPTPARKLPRTSKARLGYKKAMKDRLLFAGYKHGWLKRVKGVPNEIKS